jgi:hypothetical protein
MALDNVRATLRCPVADDSKAYIRCIAEITYFKQNKGRVWRL